MAKLYFRYGTMNSGKSLEIMKVAHNYEEQGKNVLIFSPVVGKRTDDNVIGSRVGINRPCIPVKKDTDIYAKVKKHHPSRNHNTIGCVLIDEAQFLTKEHVKQLTFIVDVLDIPVMAFGLKNDFRNELFEGSYYLLAQAESIEEIKTICWYCDKKAFMVVKFENGKPVYEGEQIVIDNEQNRSKNIFYRPVCRSCYHNAEFYE